MSPPIPPLNRILESSLYVDSLERSEAFYHEVFGFQQILSDERMRALAVPGRQVLLLFRRGGSIHRSPTPYGFIPPHDAAGTQHLCFSIDHEQFATWRNHFQRLGISIESERVQPSGGSSLYIRDPDGHSVEVATPGLWSNDPIA
jgi:catechol 2,3-dioxygenase-like lactoylglutathione lyase family enzyme